MPFGIIRLMIWSVGPFGIFFVALLSWIGPSWITPFYRAGMERPSTIKLLLVAGALKVRNAIKLQRQAWALCACTPGGDPLPLQELMSNLAVFPSLF